MTVLEFIRKNSILVLIVIAAVALGLIMMDYSGKGSMFSTNYYVQVNGTNYSDQEAYQLAENGKSYLESLASHTVQRREHIKNSIELANEALSEEAKAQQLVSMLQVYGKCQQSLDLIEEAYACWQYPVTGKEVADIAIARAILRAEAEALGIVPSKEQIDEFLTGLPAFTKTDGSFDQELYQRMVGYHNGSANNVQEKAFREVISDLIIWQSLRSLVMNGVEYNSHANRSVVRSRAQSLSGKTAWLPLAAAGEPAAPTEEELKAFWEQNKEHYMTDERRRISLFTLSPAEGTSAENLEYVAEQINQSLAQANGKSIDSILEKAQENRDNMEFSYKTAEGKSHVALPLCSQAELPAELEQQIVYRGKKQSIGQLIFAEVKEAPTVEQHDKALSEGKSDSHVRYEHMRGFYRTEDGRMVLMRVDAIEKPTPKSFEQARELALAELREQRHNNALKIKTDEIYAAMEKAISGEGGVAAAFDKAAAMGAEVSDFGPVSANSQGEAPAGINFDALRFARNDSLVAPVILPEGSRISCVTDRTIEEDLARDRDDMAQLDATLAGMIYLEWYRDAVARYKVIPGEALSNAESN